MIDRKKTLKIQGKDCIQNIKTLRISIRLCTKEQTNQI